MLERRTTSAVTTQHKKVLVDRHQDNVGVLLLNPGGMP